MLLHQYMCGGLCVSYLRNSAFVGVHNSLVGRNVQRRLLHQYLRVWLGVSCLCNSESLGVLSRLLARNLQCTLMEQYMCVGLCVSHLRNPESVGVNSSSLQEMCSGGYCTSTCVCVAVCFLPSQFSTCGCAQQCCYKKCIV